MKKNSIFVILSALVIFLVAACQSTPSTGKDSQEKDTVAAAGGETPAREAPVSVTPEKIQALVDADWDSVPQTMLDDLGFKVLKKFKEEAKDAQCDNMQYYFGRGAAVELDGEGQLTKSTAESDNAIIVYITAESVAYGSIAFRSEADFNDFKVKVEAMKPVGEDAMEFEPVGKDPEQKGYEADKWFFVNFTNSK